MARPQKEGLDWFDLSVDDDEKMMLIMAEFGLIGFAVIVRLWQWIYKNRGYYCEWTKEVALLFCQQRCCGQGINVVSEIVNAAIRRGLFDGNIYEKYKVLTSRGIQERYFEAINRRVNVKVKKEYLLVPHTRFFENADRNRVNVDRNPVNAGRNPQSRVQYSRVDQSRESTRVRADTPTPEEVKAFVRENKLRISAEKFYLYYTANGWKNITDWKAKAREWNLKEPESHASYDLDLFEQMLNED